MAKKAATRSTGKKPEENQYFEGMEPIVLPKIEKAIREVEAAKVGLESAKERLETAEASLQRAMHEHADTLGTNASGHKRYLSPKLEIVAILEVKESTEKVKLKKAPKAKAPVAE